ncbi:hypothetical protein [Streptomyces yangpuensis]|uniref:hypothetical protein n=1 Tax=Streptomyces yangpuensis TaxID=1648182 RepID=UPI0037245F96
MRKLLLVTGGVIAAVSLGLQGTATAAPTGATGWPTGCTAQTNFNNGAMARCTKNNGGHYKASAICSRLDGTGKIDVEAPIWRSSGWSQVHCPPATIFSSAGIVTKSS